MLAEVVALGLWGMRGNRESEERYRTALGWQWHFLRAWYVV